jgi:hypothetical protein
MCNIIGYSNGCDGILIHHLIKLKAYMNIKILDSDTHRQNKQHD